MFLETMSDSRCCYCGIH